jgi:hypothetical protein
MAARANNMLRLAEISKIFFSETNELTIKNSNLVKEIPMIIPLQFGFSQFISFGEEDL